MKTNSVRCRALRLLSVVWLLIVAGGSAWAQTVTESGRTQIQALAEEKEARTPVQQKIDSQLLYAAKELRGEPIAGGRTTLKADVQYLEDARVLVDIKAEVTPALLAEIARTGGTVVNSFPRFRSVRAKIFVQRVEEIATLPEVRLIRRAVGAMTNATTSEGDVTHGAAAVRSNYFARGAGVKVGVLSDSIDSLTSSYTSGELANVTVLPGQAGSGAGEGTAMLEIVRDLAPDAQLYFATAFNGAASFAQNILDLRAAGCDIIVDDVFYYSESPFQDDIVAQAVNEVTASGALYFSSAGNSGNKNDNTSGTWEGNFVDGGAAAPPVNARGGRIHSFGLANYNVCVNGGSSRLVSLFWADAIDAAHNDYDVYVLDATGSNVLRSSTSTQNGTQDPWEFIGELNVNERIVIVKASGAACYLHLDTGRGRLGISTEGSTKGHASAVDAFCVAAVDQGTAYPGTFTGGAANPVETFSSDGPRRIFFHEDGTPVTPGNFTATGGVVRQKPDLAAADGVSTTVPGFLPFYGTSAAAPHAAAIAALLKSYQPTLTPAQVRAALIAGCLDIEGSGVDRDSGVGILLAANALQAVTAPAAAPHILANGLSLVAETAGSVNSQIDPAETVTLSFSLRNGGNAPTSNLVATLLAERGVTQPSAAQTYGVLAAGGGTASRSFTFRANGPLGGTNVARLKLSDGATDLGTVEFTFNLAAGTPTTTGYSGGPALTIPTVGAATPYPSTLNVSGSTGLITKVTVTLSGFAHTYPSDVAALLVGPAGQKVLLFASAGGATAISGVNLTFDDAASASLSSGLISSGTYKAGFGAAPTFPAAAPSAPYATALSAFQGTGANGNWQLYFYDKEAPDSGAISGWSLSITTSAPGPAATGTADLAVTLAGPSSAFLNLSQALVATVRNNGPATGTNTTLTYALPNGVNYGSSSASQGTTAQSGGVVTANLGTLASGGTATVTIHVTPVQGEILAHTVSINATEADANRTNNSATLYAQVGNVDLVPYQPLDWSDKIVITTNPDSFSDDSSFNTSSIYYLGWAALNDGTLPTNAGFSASIYVDGVLFGTGTASGLAGGNYTYWRYGTPVLGPFTAGAHTIQVVVDSTGQVSESNESNNEYTKTINVSGSSAPNLTPYKPSTWSDKIVVSTTTGTTTDVTALLPANTLYVDWAVTNYGPATSNASMSHQLYVDGALSGNWSSSPPLDPFYYLSVTDYSIGTLTTGTHTLRLVVDSGNAETETNEADNEYTKTIVVGAPTLTSPASNSISGNSVNVAFSLPQAAQAGSLTLEFDPGDGSNPYELTLASGQLSAGTHSFSFNAASPSGQVSGPAIPPGTYTVTLSYRDTAGQGPATASATSVTIDTGTQLPMLSAPASGSVFKNPVGVLFNLPEAATAGTVKLTFTGSGSQILTLANGQATIGSHGFTFNPANPASTAAITNGAAITDGVYSVQLSYQDTLGNSVASVTNTNIRIDTVAPVLTLPQAITAEAASPAGVAVTYNASATDGGSGVATISYVPASGSVLPLGPTTVTATATDAAGNSNSGTFTVTVEDTTKPVASVPEEIRLYAGANGTMPLGDLTSHVDRSDLVSTPTVTQTPAAATVVGVGSHPVSFLVADAVGNNITVSTTVIVTFGRSTDLDLTLSATAGPVVKGVAKGALVPPGSGLPAGARLEGFFTPAVSDFRDMVSRVVVRSGKAKLGGVYLEDNAGAGSLLAYQTGPALDAAGDPLDNAVFASFTDPVISPGGAIAFGAKLKGAGAKGADVGIWTDLFSSTPHEMRLVLQKGREVSWMVGGPKLKSVTSVSLREEGLLALVKLAAKKGLVSSKNDVALVLITGPNTGTVMLQEGDGLPAATGTIKSMSVLQPALGSPGYGRWQADGIVVTKVIMSTKEVRLLAIYSDGTKAKLLSSIDMGTPLDPEGVWKSFGLPATGSETGPFVVAALHKALDGVVTSKNDSMLLFSDTGAAWEVLAREGAPISTASDAPVWKTFLDPLANDSGQVMFSATIAGSGVKSANKIALFAGLPGDLRIVARLGTFATDANGGDTSAVWSKFISHALPSGDQAGAVFLGEMKGGGVTSKSKLGLWAEDSTGTLRLLLRTGESVVSGGPALKDIKLLNSLPGSFGVARSYNTTGSVAVLATFTDKTQKLLRIDVP